MPSGFDTMPFQTEGLHPGKLTAGSPRIHLHLKSGKSSEPNLHCWIQNVNFPTCTHLKFNIAPEKLPSQKGKLSSKHQFSGAMLVSGRVTIPSIIFHLNFGGVTIFFLQFFVMAGLKVGLPGSVGS